MRDRLSLPVATWPRICHGQARRATASLLSLGYEPYDLCLCRPGQSLAATLTSADLGCEVSCGLLCLACLRLSRRVSCTNACTNLVRDLIPTDTRRPHVVGVTKGASCSALELTTPSLCGTRLRI